jgi:transcriptional regulator with XRE-family HTH domain
VALHPIAIYRRAKGWRQIDLAEQVRVSDTTVQKWERGIAQPRASLVPTLAAALGVDPVDLGRELAAWRPAEPGLFDRPRRRRRVDAPSSGTSS